MKNEQVAAIANQDYKWGFTSPIEEDTLPPGLNEDVVRVISEKKGEPAWLLEWRLKAYRHWRQMKEPNWQNVHYPPIDYEAIRYYSAPKKKNLASMDEVDPEVKKTFEKLGIPLAEQKFLAGVAVDAVIDSASVTTTFKKQLGEKGIIFCSFSEAVREHPDLVKKYLGTVVPYNDNFFAALNSAVFSDGSFAYIPAGVRCPVELSTYFRINAAGTGQFERTLIVAEKGSYVSYLEGCLPEWEEISTGERMKPVWDVEIGDTVMDGRGQETKIAKVMQRFYDGKMLEIVPHSSGNKFFATTEHPVLVLKASKVRRPKRGAQRSGDVRKEKLLSVDPEFVPAAEVEPGDFLVYPINKVTRDDLTLSDDFLRLLGWYVAEGCATKFNGYPALEFSLGSHEQENVDQVIRLIQSVVGKKPSVTRDEKRHGVYLVVYSKEFSELMVKHGGKYAEHKRFSKTIMDLPPQRQQLALETYYKGDGCVGQRGRLTDVRVTTVSRELAFQVQEMLSRRGVFGCVNEQPAYPETTKDGREIFHARKYCVYYAQNPRSRRVTRRGDAFLVPVRKVSAKPYQGMVFNFETAGEPHTYNVKGFVTHNCTAPMRDENQLHAAVVELITLDDAQIKYSTIQNWYPGDKEGKGGVYNFVTKRGKCLGNRSKISWCQVETGSAITWKYPSCILQGDDSVGEFYSVALTNHHQQADTGTKMIHIGKNTRSTIIAKGISAGFGQNTYRGQVKILPGAFGARNYSQCDSLLLGDKCGAHTFPYIEVKNPTAQMEHEATTSKISEEQLFYLQQRGLSAEDAVNLIVNGFCKDVFLNLPMEFAVEAQKLLGVQLEGTVG